MSKQMQHAVPLFEFQLQTAFDFIDRAQRQIDQRLQPRVLGDERFRLAQRGQLLEKLASGGIEARFDQHAALLRAVGGHERGTEPDIERRGQERPALAVSGALRDGRVTLDHADGVSGCVQLIRGGDAGDSSADDDDIHDDSSPKAGVRYAHGTPAGARVARR